jgi:hypothetical protein
MGRELQLADATIPQMIQPNRHQQFTANIHREHKERSS